MNDETSPTGNNGRVSSDEVSSDEVSSDEVSNGEVSDAASRLQRRYPGPRIPWPLMIIIVALGATAALSWLIWAALVYARPQVVAQVASYTVVSDQKVKITITVDRRNPALPARCRVIAQAPDFQPVAEQQVEIPATAARVVNVPITLTTLRRSTSASVKGCTSG